jgi:branched-subunit amino acid aminotransferase/4-amino-4-deoxychorismate lyase
MYDAATSRALARALADTPPGCEVLLWTKEERLLETCTSNIALWMHHSDVGAGGGVWVTPRLDREEEMAPEGARAVFLDGVVRQELLSKGLIMEGEVTVQDLELCREEGRPVIGFNGLRCVPGLVWQSTKPSLIMIR